MTDTRKKNIILFTGPNRVVRERALSAWIAAFERKYGAEQIVRLDVSAAPADALRAEISAMGLFASTKLVVLSGWSMAKSESTEHDGDDQKTEASSSAGTILLDFAERIPESTFVVVHAPSLDRRSKLAKFLEKSCTVKSYEAPTERDVFSFVQENFEIEPAATRLLIDRFADDLDGAARLLELLALYRADGMITVEDVRQHAPPRAAENIFPLVDALLSGDHTLAADTLVGLLVRESPYALLASLVSNLRTAVLIGRLSQEWMDADVLAASLKTHPFVIKKSLAARRNLPGFTLVYASLLDLDRRIKTGRIPGWDESGVTMILEGVIRSGGMLIEPDA